MVFWGVRCQTLMGFVFFGVGSRLIVMSERFWGDLSEYFTQAQKSLVIDYDTEPYLTA